jgi:glycosyltransferase involved in cell wall biosynthesis
MARTLAGNNFGDYTCVQSDDFRPEERTMGHPVKQPARGSLGIYFDGVYVVSPNEGQQRVSTDRALIYFICEVGSHFDQLVLFGRARADKRAADYIVPSHVRLVRLPYYSNLRRLHAVVVSVAGTARGFWRGLATIDTVWIFGPHPFALLLTGLARIRRKRVVLGVRQHSVRLYQARLPARRWAPARAAVRILDRTYRTLARRTPTTVQGPDLEEHYGGPRDNLLPIIDSVVRVDDVVAEMPERDWTGAIELLTVGRLESEKNPMLLVEAMAQLEREEPGRYRLTWVGRGPLEHAVRQRAAALGVAASIDFHGYIPFRGGLLDLYRRVHVFIHVALSEGVPKVIFEAMASATPVVATDVGGIRGALGGGQAALLVSPQDRGALVGAIRRLVNEPELRDALVSRGLDLAGVKTLEAEAERVARFIRDGGGIAQP